MSESDSAEKLFPVTVTVKPRLNFDGGAFPGIGSGGLYWLVGETKAEVKKWQLDELKAHAKAGGHLWVVDHSEEKAKADLKAKADAEAKAEEAKKPESKDEKPTGKK